MLYISAYGLESSACTEVQDLVQGNFSDDFNVCVWAGGSNDWKGAPGFENGQLNQMVIGNGTFADVHAAGKISVGRPETLTDFIVSSVRDYPAERYFLMLYDHGAGPAGGLLYDRIFRNDHLGMSDLHSALIQAQQQLGDFHIDLLSIHACLMGTVELLAACQGVADYVICSEELVLSDSLRNSFLLSELRENPDISNENLARLWLDAYQEETGGEYQLAAFDINQMGQVFENLNILLDRISSQMDESMVRDLSRARASMRDLSSSSREEVATESLLWDTVDLRSFLSAFSPFEPEQANLVLELLDNALIANIPGRDTDLCGVGILFPYDLLRESFEIHYNQYFSGQIPGLDNFIHRYCAFKKGGETAADANSLSDRPESLQTAFDELGTSSLISSNSSETPDSESTGFSSLITSGDTETAGNESSGFSSLITSGDAKTTGTESVAPSSLITSGEGTADTAVDSSSLVDEEKGISDLQYGRFDLKVESSEPEQKTDRNHEYRVLLDEDQVENLESAEGILTVLTVENGKKVYTDIGTNLDTSIDWENGTVSASFDGRWIQINGQPATVMETVQSNGLRFLIVPAALDGENIILEYVFQPGSEQGQLNRVIDSGNSDGYRALRLLNVNDEDQIYLRYQSHVFEDGQMKSFERNSGLIPIAGCRFAEIKPISHNCYISFHLEDIYGNISFSPMFSVK